MERRYWQSPGCCGSISSGEAGFTLVEVLVGLAILALSLSVSYELVATGLSRTSQAKMLAGAVLQAQSLLAKAGTELPLIEGEGELAGGYHWRLHVKQYGDAADQKAWQSTPYVVSVEVSWGNGSQKQSAVLTTLRLSK
jgi:general secretion pathway protein I